MKRQHPIAILRYTTKNFWLLIIPLVRGIMTPDFNLQNWLNGAGWDIAVVAVILLSAVLRWWFVRYEFRENCFAYSGGAFLRTEFELPYSILSAVTTKCIFWLRPTKAVSVYIDSESQSPLNKRNDADVYIIAHKNELDTIFTKIPHATKSVKMTYDSSKSNLLIFSLLFSSTLSGIIFVGTFFIEGSKIVGEQLEVRFLSAVTDVTAIASKIVNGVTPIAVGITIFIGAGWLYSFITNLLRHMKFRIQRTGKNIVIENGFFTKWKYFINTDKINYADIRQNLLMKAFSVMSVHVSCSGYGKAKNEIPVFVPITTKKRVIGSMQMLLPKFTLREVRLKPHWNYIWRFIGPPTALIFVELALCFGLIWFLPSWYYVIIFVLIMAEIPTTYLLIVKYVAYCTNGIEYSDNALTLKYCNFYQFHKIIVPKQRIAMINVQQTFFQQRNNSCDLIVYTNAEFTKSHRVKGLALSEVLTLLDEYGVNTNAV